MRYKRSKRAVRDTYRNERKMEEFLHSGVDYQVVHGAREALRSHRKLVARKGYPIEVSLIRVDGKDRVCWIRGE